MLVPVWLYSALLLLLGTGLAAALLSGAMDTDASALLTTLFSPAPSLEHTVLWDLRLPRALAAVATGGLLALAGTLLQALLRNPLADPYVLGVSGGASVGGLLVLGLGLGGMSLEFGALTGAALALLLVLLLGWHSGWRSESLLLAGVISAAGWGALVTLILSLGDDSHLKGMMFWLMGDLGQARAPLPPLLLLGLSFPLLLPAGRALDLLARGDDAAALLGLNVARMRQGVWLAAALCTAAAVTTAGNIGFIGLLAPHMLRRLGVTAHGRLLPASVLLGAALLLWADTLGRTLLAPRELPVGVVTALLGVPLFLLLLTRRTAHP
ncbi:MAG: iron ABC transporter permease [Magnetococcus sp. WYHC-3]